jgi:hypothetical protein
MLLLLLALVVIVALAYLAWRGSSSRRLFSEPHFAELAGALGPLKEAACRAGAEDAELGPDDPRIFVSSAGAAILYTVSREADRFVHHCSVSRAGGPTPHAVGGMVLLFAARVMGLPEGASFSIGPTGVHHAQLKLEPSAHTAYSAAPVTLPPAHEIRGWMRDALTRRDAISWERAELEPS